MELQSQCTCTGLLYCHLLAVEVFYYMAVNCYMKIILPDYAFIHAVAFTPSVPRTRGHLLLCSLIDMHGKIRGLKVVVFVYYQTKFLLLWQSALSWADRRQHPGVTAHRLPTVPHFLSNSSFSVKCEVCNFWATCGQYSDISHSSKSGNSSATHYLRFCLFFYHVPFHLKTVIANKGTEMPK